ncbi:AAA family ATPase [Methanosphaera sp. WGK6]|uniref:AAA family ATPase n=1 Tax=Methanosphaera sp. WGK6 TaxID=1561964 RepID=UPI00084C01E7|nr:AAA family ATPase [Methanosphaera sp. WGK6]OED29955.1 ATPase AAA [Methanosphaera sp. WGK6]
MNNRLENTYISENQLRQEISKQMIEAKVIVLKPVGYPIESNFIESPEIEVTNKELFEIYAKDQWNGYKLHKNQYIFDQKLIPDFAFQVMDIRPNDSYITNNTSILVLAQENKVKTTSSNKNYKLKDVIGQEKAKNKTKIITKYLENPDKFKDWAPKNILFYGMPGTGKTMLAQALANELNIPIKMIKATSLIGDHVGNGSRQIHELYEEARQSKPCVIFIDEIDAIALERKFQSLRGDVTEIVNALLTELDGIENNDSIITICATNTPEMLDYAIRSRFEEEIEFILPTREEREVIIKNNISTLPLECVFDVNKVVEKTKNLSGRDIKEKVLKTALHKAISNSKDFIDDEDINYAIHETKKEVSVSDTMFV